MNEAISRRALLRGASGTLIGTALAMTARIPLQAASAFADRTFEEQWRAGEALQPNFWGPLANATGGLREPYKEAGGGQRLVQYFDKGRMELTNGAVTNGLLAKQLIAGKVQVGDQSFEDRPAPAIPIAGDEDNPGPTYAALGGPAAGLLAPAPARLGTIVTASVAADGTLAAGSPTTGGGPAAIASYDDTTRHNIPQAFAQYRERAGVAAVGLAISEPFNATVRVGGAPSAVMIQAFERRVLTYTADNSPAFRVEMGNIGRHYVRWRYGDALPAAPPAPTGDQLGTVEADFVARINAYRAQNGLPALAISPSLTRAAVWLSGDMAAKGYFSHTDSLGRDMTERLRAFGATGNTTWGENIAAGNASAAETLAQFIASPEHNANMLRSEYTTIGIGRAQGAPPYGWYWATDFGNGAS